MAPTRHGLDRAWELATTPSRLPDWNPEPEPLHVLTPGSATAWPCGTRRKVLWRLHQLGRNPRPVSLKLVTADQWQGAVAELATEVDPQCGGATVTVPALPLGTYWIQVSQGGQLLSYSSPFVVGPAAGARPSQGCGRARPARPRASGYRECRAA
ncbi:Ser-Thr-rich GPI-anchored membrane family protein [Streptomyces sp. NPDC056670]|uniref:Ser-Thr-rich GPI-anchored membrane family protein n=1 Tax=unclassified Streptomyces TaxID=2593676 RepID=UPI00369E7BB3